MRIEVELLEKLFIEIKEYQEEQRMIDDHPLSIQDLKEIVDNLIIKLK